MRAPWSNSQVASVGAMNTSVRVWPVATATAQLLILLLQSYCALGGEPPPTIIDSNTIIRSLRASSGVSTRGLQIEPGAEADSGSAGSGKITLDIRFGNDSDHLTQATEGQLAALGRALASAELAQARFLIAGHTSATGSAEHNRKLSEARARAVRIYLIDHFRVAPDRIEATGYGSSRPLPNFAPNALQQRRVEIIRLPPDSGHRSSR
jgi:OOP family OmpA-OmpF porin